MELRQLRTFEAVIAHGTVTDAAVALGLAPSSVSEQVRALERSLGAALFERGAKGMRLTPAGERLRSRARQLLELAERARREVARPVLRLGALETIAATHVPAVLERLALRRPDLAVEVRSDAARDQLLTAVAAGDLDAALLLDAGDRLGGLGFPVPLPAPRAATGRGAAAGVHPAALEFVDLEPVPLALVAAAGHRLAGPARVEPADLAGEKLLVNVPACSFHLAGERLLGDAVERVRAGSVPVMRAWAERGLGVALLPAFAVADAVAAGALTTLTLDVPDLALRLVWRADREPDVRHLAHAAWR